MYCSLAFIIYLYAIALINLYLTSGRNAGGGDVTSSAIKLTADNYQSIPSSGPSHREVSRALRDDDSDEAYELDSQFVDELGDRSRGA